MTKKVVNLEMEKLLREEMAHLHTREHMMGLFDTIPITTDGEAWAFMVECFTRIGRLAPHFEYPMSEAITHLVGELSDGILANDLKALDEAREAIIKEDQDMIPVRAMLERYEKDREQLGKDLAQEGLYTAISDAFKKETDK